MSHLLYFYRRSKHVDPVKNVKRFISLKNLAQRRVGKQSFLVINILLLSAMFCLKMSKAYSPSAFTFQWLLKRTNPAREDGGWPIG